MYKRKIVLKGDSDKSFSAREFRTTATGRRATSVLLRTACVLLSWAVLQCGVACRAADSADPADWTKARMPELLELYKHLHQTPELSQKEKETSARMAKELEAIGAKVTTNIGGYG